MFFSGRQVFSFYISNNVSLSLGDCKTTDSSGEEDSDDEETGPTVDVSSQFTLIIDTRQLHQKEPDLIWDSEIVYPSGHCNPCGSSGRVTL